MQRNGKPDGRRLGFRPAVHRYEHCVFLFITTHDKDQRSNNMNHN